MDKPSIYLAGPWFTKEGLNTMNSLIRDAESIQTPMYSVYFPKENQGGTPAQVFQKDVDAITNASIILALIDEKDCGTAWEIGYAYALKKPIILMASDKKTFTTKTNLMLAFCALGRILTDDFKNYILGNTVSSVEIPNNWHDANYDT